MSDSSPTRATQFATPRIDAKALLGLYDPADTTDWAPIRAAQIAAGAQLALFLVGANVVAAMLVVLVLQPVAPLWQLVGWGALVAAVSAAVSMRRLAARQRTRDQATLRDVRDTVVEGLALALIWLVPPLAFGVRADPATAFSLTIVLFLLMTASAVAMAALPMATIGFLAVLGSGVFTMLLFAHGPVLAGVAAITTALLMMVCFGRGKALVVIRAGEISLEERDETVSLLLREFTDQSGDWLWETDPHRRVARATVRFAAALGHDPLSINGLPLLQVLAGEAWESGAFHAGLRTLADKLKNREAFRDLLLPVRIDGNPRWLQISANPRHDERGGFCGFRGVGSDVTEQRESADKIARMARFDPLTGLPNRLLVHESLAAAMEEADRWDGRCAFMMIDLDRFKAVNDTLGHPMGDRLLGRVAERLGKLITDNELIGRLGGDEFGVVVRNARDMAHVEDLARNIIATLSEPYDLDQHTLYVGASVGVAYGPRDGRSAEDLIRSADLALYRSKDGGGGRFHVYEQQLHLDAEERRVLEIALRKAVEERQLHLNYQPVVDAATGVLTGFEALVRWTHPTLGTISPVKFIPLAEDARLIAPIGEWVLRTACHEAMRWPGQTRIAVNVSPEQLHNPKFVVVVAQALAQSGLPADRLELEVTEGVFLREGTGAAQVLERVLDLGVRLSLDDFGTGYSSLGYLSRTRFSSIKIDRSFVTAAGRGEREALAIIRAVVALAQSLGMATTAEGVETAEEQQLVHALGCTKIQGYYFGRPLPVEEARAVALRHSGTARAA